MATFRIVVLKGDEKTNHTWNVKIRIVHNRRTGIIGTDKYVTKDKFNNKCEIIDSTILNVLTPTLTQYRNKEIALGSKLKDYSLKQFTEYLKRDDHKDIDFFEYIDIYLATIKKHKTWATYNTTKNRLILFQGMKALPITMVTSKFLSRFEDWLRKHREGDHFVVCSDTTINLYMRNVRALFNAARKYYNNEDIGDMQIKHFPFTKYKIPEAPESENRNLEVADIKQIRDIKTYFDKKYKKDRPLRKLDAQARDVFMISFYLIGMNTVDIYNCPPVDKDNRITYNRTKTESKRSDRAKISIDIEPELLPYLEIYKGKQTALDFCERYSSAADFNKYVNRGLKRIGAELGLKKPLTTYFARHSWATIAANDCHIDETIIQKCLNHSNPGNKALKTTRIYIKENWVVINEANRKVLDELKKEN